MKRRAHGEGSLLRRKGTDVWYAQYYRDGRQIRVSTKTAVKQEALAVLRKLMGDTERGLAPVSDTRKLRYRDLRAALLANYTEKGNKSLVTRANGEETIIGLAQLDNFFGYDTEHPGPRVAEISTETGRAFAEKRRSEGTGNATINRSLACLRRMLRLAWEEKKIQYVPVIRLLKEPPARRGFVELQKFEELIAQFPPYLKPYITFLYFCGGRSGEAELIEWTQVDLKRKIIRIEDDQTKDKEAREIPLPDRLALMLDRIHPKTGQVFDTTNIRKTWQRACAAIGVGRIIDVPGKKYDPRYEGLTLHDFRRSAIRNLVTLAGVREKVAMEITGHKTRSVFDRYHIVDTADVSHAMRQWESTAANLVKGANLVQKSNSRTRNSLMALSSRG